MSPSDLDGMPLAEDLAGPYDVLARVQASGLDQLGRLVVAHIQVVDRRHPHPDLHGAPSVAA
jgi:hypothetical protein